MPPNKSAGNKSALAAGRPTRGSSASLFRAPHRAPCHWQSIERRCFPKPAGCQTGHFVETTCQYAHSIQPVAHRSRRPAHGQPKYGPVPAHKDRQHFSKPIYRLLWANQRQVRPAARDRLTPLSASSAETFDQIFTARRAIRPPSVRHSAHLAPQWPPASANSTPKIGRSRAGDRHVAHHRKAQPCRFA